MRIQIFVGVVAAIAMTAAAGAGPNLEFSVGLCAAKTNAKARLACYDAIAAQLKAGEPLVAATPPRAPGHAVPVPAAPVPVAAAPAPAAAPVIAAPVPAAPAPVAAAPAPVVAPPPVAAPVQPEAQFGAERLDKPTRDAAGQPAQIDEIKGTITSFSFLPNGRVLVTLSNGQVWRQIDGDNERFKGKEGELATIERGIFGSYNLTVEGRNQLLKVQRVR
jgi:hypothetical protein